MSVMMVQKNANWTTLSYSSNYIQRKEIGKLMAECNKNESCVHYSFILKFASLQFTGHCCFPVQATVS